ncbi:Hypothetical predicted protein [Paramuricea clavata]|uniref:Uncharacterized protein n=1 Tax=Paramuricea clavata TaxID=317549 RepID=A0A7D9M182_PARCT|nr:Hypothetical predicted protein [Paramuricea clavata]
MAKAALVLTAFLAIFLVKVDAGMDFDWDYFRDFLAHIIQPDPCGADVIAYYKFDRSVRDVCFGHNAQKNSGTPVLDPSTGISNAAVKFQGFQSSQLHVPSLNGYAWGSKFSVSFWFKTSTRWHQNIQGLINNGPVSNETTSSGSLEIYLNTGNYIGASIVTSHSAKAWPRITTAVPRHWHHLVMTYDGKTINFYLNNHLKLTDTECCHGNIVSKNSDVVLGHIERYYGYGYDYSYGTQAINSYIDEMKLFKKALTAHEVLKLYRLKVV